MKISVYNDTIFALNLLAEKNKEVIVFYSGGKDSLCVLDLCSKIFEKVVCVFMYFIPGLACAEKQLQYARDKYGVEIKQYPHWVFVRSLIHVFCDNYYFDFPLKEIKLKDVYRMAREDTGIKIITQVR